MAATDTVDNPTLNPHHTNLRQALDSGCSWGVAAQLRRALEKLDGIELVAVNADDELSWTESGGICRTVRFTLGSGDSQRQTWIRIPFVAGDGSILFEQHDYAPIAFIRPNQGLHHLSRGADPFRLLVPWIGRPVTVADRAGVRWVSVPRIGRSLATDVVAALRGSAGHDARSRRIASALRTAADALPGHAPEDLVEGTLEATFDEIEFHGDLANNRLILAGHHFADAVGRGARRAVARLIQRPSVLDEATDLIATLVQRELEALLGAGGRDPDGGLNPFEVLDDTNVLSRFEHCRRVSRLGAGGIDERSHLATALRDIHPSHLGVLCPLNTPESARVGLVRHMTLAPLIDHEGHLPTAPSLIEDLSPEQFLSASALLLPFLNHDDAVRGILATKSIRQFVPLIEPELPRLSTGFEQRAAEAMLAARFADGHQPVEVGPEGVRIGSAALPYRRHAERATLSGTHDGWTPAVGTGTPPADTVVVHRPGTTVLADRSGVALTPGVNARCGVLPFRGLTAEDAVVVSASLAHRMRSRHLTEVTERLAPNEFARPRTERSISAMHGTKIEAGTDLVDVFLLDDLDPELQATAPPPRRTITAPVTGTIAAASVTRLATGERDVRFLFVEERPLMVGDKVTARHGNKGVVSAVLADEEMPKIAGQPLDLVISPFGPLRRMVVGLFMELAATSAGDADAGAPFGSGSPLASDGPASITMPDDSIVHAQAGWLYILKLNHLAAVKLQAQDWTPLSATNGQPARVRIEERGSRLGRPQRLGEMEFWALQALGASAVVRDALGTRRGDGGGVPSTLRAVSDHLHAAAIVTEFTLADGTSVSSIDPVAVSAAVSPVTSVSFTLLDTDVIPEHEFIQPEDAGDAMLIAKGRRSLARDKVRPDDNRRRNEPHVDPLTAWGPGVTACACSTPGCEAGELCDRCGRVVVAAHGDASRHGIRYIKLPVPIAHPWFQPLVQVGLDADLDGPALTQLEVDVSEVHDDLRAPADDIATTIAAIPVIAPAYRPAIRARDGAVLDHELTRRYRRLCAAVVNYNEAREGTDGDSVRTSALRAIEREVADILGRASGVTTGIGTIAHRLRFKEGLLRRHLLGSTEWRTAYGVIGPDPNLEIDQVGLPRMVIERLGLAEDQWVIVNRYPTLLPTGIVSLRVVPVDGNAITLPPSVLPMLAADYDGDMVAIHGVSDQAVQDLVTRLHPARHLRSPATGEPLVYLGEELGAIDPMLQDAIASAAKATHTAFFEATEGALAESFAKARRSLRDAYLGGYQAGTGLGTVSLETLRDSPPSISNCLDEAIRSGVGDGVLKPIREAVGPQPNYATRARREATRTIETGFLEGLSRAELIDNARNAVTRLGDKKLLTPTAGDFTKTLVDALYEIVIVEGDCNGEMIQRHDLSVRAERRAGTPSAVRSPIRCQYLRRDARSVCQTCYGNDLQTQKPVTPGARVGITAALVIGERGTQLALKAIHATTQQTALDPLRTAVRKRDAKIVAPSATPDGGLVDPSGDESPTSWIEDPLALVRLFRSAYTPRRHPDRIDADEPPSLDDIHLEVMAGGLAAGRALGTARSPLAEASLRGRLDAILAAASGRGARQSGSPARDALILRAEILG